MIASDYIRLPLRNVLRGKFRTLLSACAMAVGVACVMLLSAIGTTGKVVVNDQLERIGISGIMVFAGEYGGLSMSDGRRVAENVTEVSLAMPFDINIEYYSFRMGVRKKAALMYVDENIDRFMNFELLAGRLLNENDCVSGRRVCVIDSTVALENYKRIDITGKTISLEIDSTVQEFTVVGVIETQVSLMSGLTGGELPAFIYIPYASANANPDKSVDQIVFKIIGDDGTAADNIRQVLTRTNQNGGYYQIENITGYRTQIDSALNTVTLVLSVTAGISLFVAGIGVMNAMLSTVSERYSEIGICMAIGAKRWQIAVLFLTEALIISVIGAIAGAVLGAITTYVACNLVGVTPVIAPTDVFLPMTVTVLIGVLSGIIPALKAASLQPAIAIRKD